VKRRKKFISEALVQWKQLSAEDATWEDAEQLQQQFPAINLADKVPLQGGANDRNPRRSQRITHPNKCYIGKRVAEDKEITKANASYAKMSLVKSSITRSQ
jgi:hypothetical protein